MYSNILSGTHIGLRDSDTDPTSLISDLFFGRALRDRFNITNHLSPIAWSSRADEILKPFDTTVTMSHLINARAQQILEEHPEGDVVVSWSGGVDSTAVAVALLRNGIDPTRLHLICNEASVSEYPLFVDLVLAKGAKVTVEEDDFYSTLGNTECACIVNGCVADHLFGSIVSKRIPSAYNLPWMDALPQFFAQAGRTVTAKQYEEIEAVYTDYFNKLGIPVTQWCEFAFAWSYGNKWSYTRNDQNLEMFGMPNSGKAIAFFDTPEFERWALTRFDKIKSFNVIQKPKYYKVSLKRYIYTWTDDAKYLKGKGKMNSMVTVLSDRSKVVIQTEDGLKKFTCKGRVPDGHYLSRKVGEMCRKEGR